MDEGKDIKEIKVRVGKKNNVSVHVGQPRIYVVHNQQSSVISMRPSVLQLLTYLLIILLFDKMY